MKSGAHHEKRVWLAFLSATVIASAAFATIPRAGLAARSVVTTLNAGGKPNYAVATSAGTFVVMSSGSNGILQVLDGRSFTLAPYGLTVASNGGAVRSITTSFASPAEVAAGTATGTVQQWDVSQVASLADGGAIPAPRVFHLVNNVSDQVTAVALDDAGLRLFAGDNAAQTVTTFDDTTTTATTGAILLGQSPVNAVSVITGSSERVFFGTESGSLAWIDVNSLQPAVLTIDATLTHDLTRLTSGLFAGLAPRLAVIDATSDTLYVIDPAGPIVVDSIGLAQHPTAVAISGSDTSTVIWVAEDTSTGGTSNRVEAFTQSLAVAQTAVTLTDAPVSLTEGSGYLYAGLAGGQEAVITDHPYLDITATNPNPVHVRGADITVTFTSTESGNALVLMNGNLIVSQQPVVAGAATTITLPGASLTAAVFPEGRTNRLRVELTGTTTGSIGHDEVVVPLDLPPPTPSGFSVGFGDSRVIGDWDPTDVGEVPDFKDYVVRFGTSVSGTNGIPGCASADCQSPQRTTYSDFSVLVSNGTTVFMSVMAEDSAGNLSAPTAVLNGTAQPTSGAAELSGDTGGFLFKCDVGHAPRAGGAARALAAVAGAAVAALLLRRSKRRENGYPRS